MKRMMVLMALLCAFDAFSATPECSPPTDPAYQGPLFDSMAQTDQFLDGESAIKTAQANGVTGIALFARVHRKANGKSLVQKLAREYPNFIILGAPKLFDMRYDLDSSFIDDVLTGVAERRYAFVGEILYTHGDKIGGEETSSGERYIDPMRPGTAKLINGLKNKSVPVMMHWEVYDWVRDWPKFDQLYGEFPDQIFVWPHLGFGSADKVAIVLAAHKNVWATLSKKELTNANLSDDEKSGEIGPPVVDQCDVLQPEWKDLMIRFQDRLLFATDAHKEGRWKQYEAIVNRWRVILGQLPPDVAKAIAYQNASRLYAK